MPAISPSLDIAPSLPSPPAVEPLEISAAGRTQRPARSRRLPSKYKDAAPESILRPLLSVDVAPPPDAGPNIDLTSTSAVPPPQAVASTFSHALTTTRNCFGISRPYFHRPSRIPGVDLPIHALLDDTLPVSSEVTPGGDEDETDQPNSKPKADRSAFLEVFRAPGFSMDDLDEVKAWNKMVRHMDDHMAGKSVPDDSNVIGDGWLPTPLKIQVLFAAMTGASTTECAFTVTGVHRRKKVPLIKEVLTNDPAVKFYHFDPLHKSWIPPANPPTPPQRVFDELYSADAFNEAYIAVQTIAREAGDTTPHAIAAPMLASDSTHLTSFVTAKIQPLYLAFGNQSEYELDKPTS